MVCTLIKYYNVSESQRYNIAIFMYRTVKMPNNFIADFLTIFIYRNLVELIPSRILLKNITSNRCLKLRPAAASNSLPKSKDIKASQV